MGQKEPLTAVERKAYDGIVAYIKENGYAPTVREICDITGYLSSSTAFFLLKSLSKKGWVKTNGTRAIKVIGYKFVKENTHERTEDQSNIH